MIFAILGLAGFIHYLVDKSNIVRTLSGVSPTDGEITAAAGSGVAITPNLGTSTVEFDHILTRDTLLPFGDPAGPQVSYFHITGLIFPITENSWRMGLFPGFFPVFLPGVVPGDGGQGNNFINWRVPAVGQYSINAYCIVYPSARRSGDHQSFTMMLNLGATTADPTISGFIPQGGAASLDISSSTTSGPSFPLRMSVSANIHAGCPGCPVSVNDRLTVHIRQDHVGGGGAVTFATACRIQVTRNK
jgi:hypothetical protein